MGTPRQGPNMGSLGWRAWVCKELSGLRYQCHSWGVGKSLLQLGEMPLSVLVSQLDIAVSINVMI